AAVLAQGVEVELRDRVEPLLVKLQHPVAPMRGKLERIGAYQRGLIGLIALDGGSHLTSRLVQLGGMNISGEQRQQRDSKCHCFASFRCSTSSKREAPRSFRFRNKYSGTPLTITMAPKPEFLGSPRAMKIRKKTAVSKNASGMKG